MANVSGLAPPPKESAFTSLRRWWGGHAIAQAVGLAGAALVVVWLGANVVGGMHRLGMAPNLDYLSQPANFDISESLLAYHAGDPYARAILVGVLNTVKLAVAGCALATALGVALGVARIAGNPLLSGLIAAYVEAARNTPLTLQLFFWIAATRALPPVRQALRPLPDVYFSVRGVYLPSLSVESGEVWPILALIVALALVVRFVHRRLRRPLRAREWLLVAAAALVAPTAWIRLDGLRFALDAPTLKGFNIVGGLSLTPEFAAMLVGLSLYYAANIAEIVRSGLQSVSAGQWEAARALGLAPLRVLQLVVLPQAMRVITPLMTSSYLDLTKDTTLGVLIGFTELTAVIKTSANNTGNAVETILALVVVFLSISLPVSAAINAYNRALARRGFATR
jgi:general L-amino acid transport system permease protein